MSGLYYQHICHKSVMGVYHLGEFEEIVMLTIEILQGEAYGVTIAGEIENRLRRNVSLVPCRLY